MLSKYFQGSPRRKTVRRVKRYQYRLYFWYYSWDLKQITVDRLWRDWQEDEMAWQGLTGLQVANQQPRVEITPMERRMEWLLVQLIGLLEE